MIKEVEVLKKFKEKSGWSYRRLSAVLGLNLMTIYFWLSGKYNPSKLALEKLRGFLSANIPVKIKEKQDEGSDTD